MRMIVLAVIAALAASPVLGPAVGPVAGDVLERAEDCAERGIGATAGLHAPGDSVGSASDLVREVREHVRAFVSCVRQDRRPAFKRAPTREGD